MSDPMKDGQEKIQAEEHDKRIRAEVLAACINRFDQYLCSCSTNFVGKPKSEHEKSCPKYVVGVLRKLQPAASDLEELLREEYLRGHQDALREVISRSVLEKARAILGKE